MSISMYTFEFLSYILYIIHCMFNSTNMLLFNKFNSIQFNSIYE